VDTISQFAHLVGDRENNAGDALAAMQPLSVAIGHGLAVVIVRHERKKGGQVGTSGRGSSAFSGAADIVLSLRRLEGQTRPNLREIHGLSRFSETPDLLTIELVGSEYVSLGDRKQVTFEETKERILEAMPASKGEALSARE
jgi:hypothetical protein